MRKKLLNLLFVILILPVMVLTGCKKGSSSLPAINVSKYFKDEITISRYNIAEDSTDSISFLTQKKAKKENLSKYVKFELNADPVWIYKMYVESIVFYVYCNESSEFQMTINVKMTNLADESAILESKSDNVATEDVEQQVTIMPKGKKAIKCVVPINKTVVNSLGSTITIDFFTNSQEIFSSVGENESSLMWLIYGFQVHGESRTYSRTAN